MSYLSYLQAQLREKKEQLYRLKNCASKLDALQGEFFQNQKLINDPELTSTTWNGELANKFTYVREDLSLSYKELFETQLNTVIMTIEHKVTSIKIEIQTLESSIAYEKARIEMERKKVD
ncbi:DUF5082 family protein [Bacillus sp. FJAT-47783]|uniref:YwqH-like family protein n=1 Tax=Bacillus sp. FJAT-47783 TaxID=2922712 RepID=UPI001FACF23B|nr:DUF5082 family protein [Bacillus sp. FJAT-47783]